MSKLSKFLGKAGKVAKKVGGAVGDVAKRAAPLATFIPGVGPVAAGIIGVGGGLLGKLNDQNVTFGNTLRDAAIGGVTGYGGARLIDRFAPGRIGQWANAPGGGLPARPGDISSALPPGMRSGSVPGISRLSLPAGAGPGGGGPGGDGGGFDWGRLLQGVGKYAPLALGAAGAFQNAQQATQNRELTQEQIQQARDAIARQRMLQDRALSFQPVATPDYSSLFRSQNPFSQPAGAQ